MDRATAAELATIDRYKKRLAGEFALVGFDEVRSDRLWSEGVTRLQIELGSAFHQTPGEGAGRPV